MRAVVASAFAPIESSPLTAVDMPVPSPGAGEVLVRVRCCAACRTDLHVIEGDLPRARRPIIPGHQIVGTVEARGPDCTRFAIGQRVGVAWLRHTCGECPPCRAGRENLCPNSRYTGYHEHGGYAEFALVHEDYAYALPDAFADQHAAPLLCAGIIGYRALQRAELPPGGRLALFGFGSSAHIVLQLALHRGSEVYVVSREDDHLALARDLGAAWAGRDAMHMPRRVSSAILFAPVGYLVPVALERLEPGGTLALAGIHMTDVPPLNYGRHLFHERNLRSVQANTRADGRQLLEEAAQIPLRPRTVEYALDDANRALQDLKAGRILGTAVLTL